MFSDLLKKYLDENVKEGDPHFSMFWQCLGAIGAAEKKESEQGGDYITKINGESMADEASKIVERCIAKARSLTDADKMREDYLTALISLTGIMMDYIKNKQRIEALSPMLNIKSVDYSGFIKNIRKMVKMLEDDDLIMRGEQGQFEIREDIDYDQHEEKLITSDDFLANEQKEGA